jgi:hypothetical protein
MVYFHQKSPASRAFLFCISNSVSAYKDIPAICESSNDVHLHQNAFLKYYIKFTKLDQVVINLKHIDINIKVIVGCTWII